MASVITASASHGAGSNHANSGPADLPIEPRRKETPDEFRARMEEKAAKQREFAAGARAAGIATYNASVQPRVEEPDLDDEDTVVPPDAADVAEPAATPARPVPGPPRAPVHRPTASVQQDLAMVTAYVDGDSAKDLAERFGISTATVLKRLRAAGVQIRPQGHYARPLTAQPTPAVAAPAPVAAAPDPQPAAAPAEPSTSRYITPDELAQMVADYEAGKTPPEIAEATGRTAKNVRTALERAGVRMRDDRALRSGGQNRRVDDAELVEQVRSLYVDEGLTQAVVADRLGLTLKVVQGVMTRNGIETRPDAVGIKRERPAPPERTPRYRDPDAAARPSTADVGPAVTPPNPSRTVIDGDVTVGLGRTLVGTDVNGRVTLHGNATLHDVLVRGPAPSPAATEPRQAPSLDEALAAAGAGVRALLAAVEDLTTAAVRVHEARVAAAQASVAGIHQAADQLLAALGEPTTEGARA